MNVIEGQGITLRDRFALAAPENPQPWFYAKVPEPPKDDWRSRNNPDFRYTSYFAACKDGGEWNAAQQEKTEYDEMVKAERLKQWPYAWADAMLAERNTGRP